MAKAPLFSWQSFADTKLSRGARLLLPMEPISLLLP
jgi:hypothetical protein